MFCLSLLNEFLTDSALWAGSVIKLPCPYVCLSVIKVIIVYNGQVIKFFVFLHKLESVCLVFRILTQEGHQKGIIGSKVTMTLTIFLSLIIKGFFGFGTRLLWIMGQSAGEGLWLLALVTGGM